MVEAARPVDRDVGVRAVQLDRAADRAARACLAESETLVGRRCPEEDAGRRHVKPHLGAHVRRQRGRHQVCRRAIRFDAGRACLAESVHAVEDGAVLAHVEALTDNAGERGVSARRARRAAGGRCVCGVCGVCGVRGGRRAHRHLLLVLADVVGVDGAQEGEILLGAGSRLGQAQGWGQGLGQGLGSGIGSGIGLGQGQGPGWKVQYSSEWNLAISSKEAGAGR